MTKEEELEFYGDIRVAAGMEGQGYYIRSYTGPETFNSDEELKQAFIEARKSMDNFFDLVDKRIKECGGNPDDYEA